MNQTIQNELLEQLDISIEKDENKRGEILKGLIQVTKSSPVDSLNMVVITEKDTTYTPKRKKELSLDEKISKAKQTVLYDINPLQMDQLDSLLTSCLKEKNIQVQTIIYVEDNLKGTGEYSGTRNKTDKKLLKEPILLGARNELSIQVYYRVPGKYILSQIPVIYWYVSGSWILISMYLLYFSPKWMEWLLKTKDHSCKRSSFYPEKICKELLPDLFYHPVNHQLIYKEELFTFSGQSQRLLQSFISNPYHTLSLEEMKQQAWKRNFVTDDAVRTAISRLKKELNTIPSIRLVTINGAGYRMEFILCPESTNNNKEEDSHTSTINSACRDK